VNSTPNAFAAARALDRHLLRAILDTLATPSRTMPKLTEIAERIKQERANNSQLGDEIAARLDALPAKRLEAKQRANQVMDELHGDVDGLEAELRQISNLPLG
jgi:septal ring factor EnvC (AmiA/AmiB activator)